MKKSDKVIAFLGNKAEFEGNLSYHGAVRIDGHFKGEISSDGTLIVGEKALIEGNIHCSHVVVNGEVQGNITANERVAIHAPGKVFGDIFAPGVVIGEGVIFEGRTHMYKDPEAGTAPVSDHVGAELEPTGSIIFGVVADRVTGDPINGAQVACEGTKKRATSTNASGYYELIGLEDGKWKLRVNANGCKKGKASVEISGLGAYEQNFHLKPR
jgi:cytoskeletal protein CcmA (bactofilin family)